MLKNYKNMIRIWQFRAIHGAMIRPNIKFFHDGLLTPAVRIFCSLRLRALKNKLDSTVSTAVFYSVTRLCSLQCDRIVFT